MASVVVGFQSPSSTGVGKHRLGESSAISSSQSTDVDMEGLRSLGFTSGLCEALIRQKEETSHRFWILDNSGSMSIADGHRFVQSSRGEAQLSPCTRWNELQEAAIYHSKLAGFLQLPTEFQFLNSPGFFQKSFVVRNENDALKAQQTIKRAEPIGATPLTPTVESIRNKVKGMMPQLLQDGTSVSLVIATDGLPTDSMGYGGKAENAKFTKALGSLTSFPVTIVIRLCTDDESVVDFYGNLDNSLELNLDVLDDFAGEAQEVHTKNKWLSYGLPLHRFREGAFRSRLADLLDERKFTKDELRDFCGLLFGESVAMDGLPDPQADWAGFHREVDHLQAYEDLVYNPMTRQMAPWIQVPRLGACFTKPGKEPCRYISSRSDRLKRTTCNVKLQ
ncbi:expressed unknown protein [Seminavis robusta]|uniref:Uncharacterized protein n=1 Tax=Seminavis robusta TaxID=568900 RepID=A0A9N8E321_9STRA|nr:expressed unknown protein [Seminavis robusta]|eukprot:Sro599_g173190.1 n/a (392) ;mRNA; r:15344-16519